MTTTKNKALFTRAGVTTTISVLSAACVDLGAGDVSTWLGRHAGVIAAGVLAVGPGVVAWLAREGVDVSGGLADVEQAAGQVPAVADVAQAFAEAERLFPAAASSEAAAAAGPLGKVEAAVVDRVAPVVEKVAGDVVAAARPAKTKPAASPYAA